MKVAMYPISLKVYIAWLTTGWGQTPFQRKDLRMQIRRSGGLGKALKEVPVCGKPIILSAGHSEPRSRSTSNHVSTRVRFLRVLKAIGPEWRATRDSPR